MKQRFKKKRYLPKSIYLINNYKRSTHGLQVSVTCNYKTKCKFFSFSKYNSFEDCLQAAITCRNLIEKGFNKARSENQIFSQGKSNTGILGISLIEKENKYFVSWTTSEGTEKHASFAFLKHGKEEALKKAKELRKQRESERIIRTKDKRGY